MAILAESQRRAVAQRLEELAAPVEVELFVRDTRLFVPGRECPRCEETVQLLQEVCQLSPHLHLTVRDLDREAERGRELGVEHTPTLVIHGRAGGRVRFVGLPMGYEFASLLEALVDAGRGPASAAAAGVAADPAGAGAAAEGPAAATGASPAEPVEPAEPAEPEEPGAPVAPLDPGRLARLEAAGETVHLRVFFTPT